MGTCGALGIRVQPEAELLVLLLLQRRRRHELVRLHTHGVTNVAAVARRCHSQVRRRTGHSA